MGGVIRGDLGNSLWSGASITGEILRRLPVTLELGAIAIIVALILALPLGIYSAIRQDTAGDYVTRSMALLVISVPAFWL